MMRILESTYWLELAGTHGVWGLDDYHFLSFLFGSAQLRGGTRHLRPEAIHDNKVVDELANNYMYFTCIKFINSVCLSIYICDDLSSGGLLRLKLLLTGGTRQC
ncbi:hypothetical protein PISMIDRAFT_618310 [Pisolithus microcarpus 441]|uniref:Serine/threonine-protein phosphatase 2A activator n=1 Tax=Pisolithus microcarpus 441 TaxID=765257 RepID=A0A0C9YSQ2_9AGAM|nr:hypothetical protein BKA83DRAFT_618310 [Pisolithus microcarpus]KIK19746.1 hypothetical protein PISMIDRAFT_618310 [Pisolithus microcarpus 441]